MPQSEIGHNVSKLNNTHIIQMTQPPINGLRAVFGALISTGISALRATNLLVSIPKMGRISKPKQKIMDETKRKKND